MKKTRRKLVLADLKRGIVAIDALRNQMVLIGGEEFKKKMAERTGLEPASPYGRRFSRPLHYHYATSPHAGGRIENIAQSGADYKPKEKS
jgi:hypothetical protein